MRWRTLDEFRDPAVPKLHNLRLAGRAGLLVPPTAWALAADLAARPADGLPGSLPDGPCIVRSGAPSEDTPSSSNAGRFLSVLAVRPADFPVALRSVVAALRRQDGAPLGVVFVQPWIRAETAGVTFFDGFYFEETWDVGSNVSLTSGRAR